MRRWKMKKSTATGIDMSAAAAIAVWHATQR